MVKRKHQNWGFTSRSTARVIFGKAMLLVGVKLTEISHTTLYELIQYVKQLGANQQLPSLYLG